MARTIILILILMSSLQTIGQDSYRLNTTKQKYGRGEIGINIYNITGNSFSSISTLNQLSTLNQHFMVGLMYKHHYNKTAVRIGFDYYHSKFSFEYDGTYFYLKDEGQDNIGELRLGFERKLATTRLRPFLAADLTMTYGKIKGIQGGRGDFNPVYTESPYRYKIAEIGIAPAAGLNYYLSKKLSIAIETNVSLAYYYHENLDNSKINTSLRIFYNPLRLLSVNYHL